MNKLYAKYIKQDTLPTLFCPGCGNGIVQHAAMEAFDRLGIKNEVACVSGIGCSSWIPCYYQLDCLHTMHGRAIAFAEGLKLAQPDKKIIVFTGDGDCLAIGGNHLLHASSRNIDLTVIMVNNFIYGMTGGQMAPTTLVGMKSSTCPYGRDVELHGYPLKITEIAAQLEGTAYVTRQSVQSVPAIRKAKKAIRKAFENSMNGKGSNLVEIVSTCSSGWKMTPEKSNKWMEEHMFPFYPLGDLKDKE